MRRRITAESVTIGHPDKLADLIADSILTACLEQDRDNRVACEVLLTAGKCVIAGEITTAADVDYEGIAAREIEYAGYNSETVEIEVCLHEQSPDISNAVNGVEEQGAGDQGIVYGYATDETEEYLPLAFVIARKLTKAITTESKGSTTPIRPDGKSQVTILEGDTFTDIETVILSAQHVEPKDDVQRAKIIQTIFNIAQGVTEGTAGKYKIEPKHAEYLINPSGNFVVGGFEADTGLTGRKLMVDTYGGIAHHGGGAFSGKDPSKLDRSGAYMARYIAKNIVGAHLARRCEVQLAYAIGEANPVSLDVETFGTSYIPKSVLEAAVRIVFSLTPKEITKQLNLKEVNYREAVILGHFGDYRFPWETLNKTEALTEAVYSNMKRYGAKKY